MIILTTSPALAAEDAAVAAIDTCADEGELIVELPDRELAACEALAGEPQVRMENEHWRTDRIRSLRTSRESWEMVIRGLTAEPPRPGTFSGVVVEDVVLATVDDECGYGEVDEADLDDEAAEELGEDEDLGQEIEALRDHTLDKGDVDAADSEDLEWVAVLSLEGPLADACGAEETVLRLDDGFGRTGRVVALGKEGLLVERRGAFFFLGRDDVVPEFDVVWQSGFSLMGELPYGEVSKKKKRKRRRKRRKRRKRRRRRR